MKARILHFGSLVIGCSILFASCQKSNSDTSTDYTAETSTHADDQSRFSNENDAVANDVDVSLEASPGFNRGEGVQTLICDATITVDTISNPRTITITYNGNNCLGTRTRTGVVVISMAQGVRWRNPGAAISVTFQNFKVTRLSDNKSITINGTQTFTNVTGGLLINLPQLGTITHTIASSNMSVTFDDNTQRTWQVARQRIFTFSNGVVITETGTHTDGTTTGIAEWGTNRFGHAFTTAIATPIVLRQDCSFRIGAGVVTHTTSLYSASVTFGLDANGNPTGCPGSGNYYMKIIWTGSGGHTHTAILPY
jgi:hypothetical protein